MASDALIWCWLSNTPWTGQCSTNHRPLQRQLHVISRSLQVCLGMGSDEMMRLAQHGRSHRRHRWAPRCHTGQLRERGMPRGVRSASSARSDLIYEEGAKYIGTRVRPVRVQLYWCFAHRRIAKRPRAPASNNPTPRRLRSPTRGGPGCTATPAVRSEQNRRHKKPPHAHDSMIVAELACIEPHRGSDCHLSQAQAHPSLTRPSPGPLR